VLHVGDHQFVERTVLNLFVGLMLNSWYVDRHCECTAAINTVFRTSATNAARIYNTCLSQPENHPDDWISLDLRTEQVWDGFCLLTLLEDHAHRQDVLTLPHDGEQKNRFTEVMKARNLRMQQAGQEEYAHVCKKCVRVWEDEDGKPIRKSMFPAPVFDVLLTMIQRSAACL
jgi:hypothetical protein